MITSKPMILLKSNYSISTKIVTHYFSTSTICCAAPRKKNKHVRTYNEYTDFALWRKSRGLDTNPNTYSALTNLPDYSYLDGRVVPVSSNLAKRLIRQAGYAQRIVALSEEIDFAIERHKASKEEEIARKKEIISSKLKPKG